LIQQGFVMASPNPVNGCNKPLPDLPYRAARGDGRIFQHAPISSGVSVSHGRAVVNVHSPDGSALGNTPRITHASPIHASTSAAATSSPPPAVVGNAQVGALKDALNAYEKLVLEEDCISAFLHADDEDDQVVQMLVMAQNQYKLEMIRSKLSTAIDMKVEAERSLSTLTPGGEVAANTDRFISRLTWEISQCREQINGLDSLYHLGQVELPDLSVLKQGEGIDTWGKMDEDRLRVQLSLHPRLETALHALLPKVEEHMENQADVVDSLKPAAHVQVLGHIRQLDLTTQPLTLKAVKRLMAIVERGFLAGEFEALLIETLRQTTPPPPELESLLNESIGMLARQGCMNALKRLHTYLSNAENATSSRPAGAMSVETLQRLSREVGRKMDLFSFHGLRSKIFLAPAEHICAALRDMRGVAPELRSEAFELIEQATELQQKDEVRIAILAEAVRAVWIPLALKASRTREDVTFMTHFTDWWSGMFNQLACKSQASHEMLATLAMLSVTPTDELRASLESLHQQFVDQAFKATETDLARAYRDVSKQLEHEDGGADFTKRVWDEIRGARPDVKDWEWNLSLLEARMTSLAASMSQVYAALAKAAHTKHHRSP
jgi:hypothetical protein